MNFVNSDLKSITKEEKNIETENIKIINNNFNYKEMFSSLNKEKNKFQKFNNKEIESEDTTINEFKEEKKTKDLSSLIYINKFNKRNNLGIDNKKEEINKSTESIELEINNILRNNHTVKKPFIVNNGNNFKAKINSQKKIKNKKKVKFNVIKIESKSNKDKDNEKVFENNLKNMNMNPLVEDLNDAPPILHEMLESIPLFCNEINRYKIKKKKKGINKIRIWNNHLKNKYKIKHKLNKDNNKINRRIGKNGKYKK